MTFGYGPIWILAFGQLAVLLLWTTYDFFVPIFLQAGRADFDAGAGLSGFFLIVWVYYLHAELYTVDPSVLELAPWQAAAIGIGALAVGWFVYDGLCRSPLGRNDRTLGIAVFVYILLAAFVFRQVFSGRAAFLHTGAMIATWMSVK